MTQKKSCAPTPDQFEIIQKVCRKLCSRFTFVGYDADDIYQEGIIIALEIFPKWNGTKLERWLTVSISNRLRNLVYRHGPHSKNPDIKEKLEKLFYAACVEVVDESSLPYYELDLEELDIKMLFEDIDEHMPLHLRPHYLQMRAGETINIHKRNEILKFIRELLEIEDGQTI